MTLGEQIKKAREEKNLSQEALAERVGVSRQAVSKWESGTSVPRGAHRLTLSQLLCLELPDDEPVPKSGRGVCIAGWLAAGLLICALALSLHMKQESPTAAPEAPAFLSIHFYDKKQEEVFPEALWYNTAAIDSILVQWTGTSPGTVQMFFTPSGSETVGQTDLLTTKPVLDGEHAVLLSAEPLRENQRMGHLSFALSYGGGSVLNEESYNIFYDESLLELSQP